MAGCSLSLSVGIGTGTGTGTGIPRPRGPEVPRSLPRSRVAIVVVQNAKGESNGNSDSSYHFCQ